MSAVRLSETFSCWCGRYLISFANHGKSFSWIRGAIDHNIAVFAKLKELFAHIAYFTVLENFLLCRIFGQNMRKIIKLFTSIKMGAGIHAQSISGIHFLHQIPDTFTFLVTTDDLQNFLRILLFLPNKWPNSCTYRNVVILLNWTFRFFRGQLFLKGFPFWRLISAIYHLTHHGFRLVAHFAKSLDFQVTRWTLWRRWGWNSIFAVISNPLFLIHEIIFCWVLLLHWSRCRLVPVPWNGNVFTWWLLIILLLGYSAFCLWCSLYKLVPFRLQPLHWSWFSVAWVRISYLLTFAVFMVHLHYYETIIRNILKSNNRYYQFK